MSDCSSRAVWVCDVTITDPISTRDPEATKGRGWAAREQANKKIKHYTNRPETVGFFPLAVETYGCPCAKVPIFLKLLADTAARRYFNADSKSFQAAKFLHQFRQRWSVALQRAQSVGYLLKSSEAAAAENPPVGGIGSEFYLGDFFAVIEPLLEIWGIELPLPSPATCALLAPPVLCPRAACTAPVSPARCVCRPRAANALPLLPVRRSCSARTACAVPCTACAHPACVAAAATLLLPHAPSCPALPELRRPAEPCRPARAAPPCRAAQLSRLAEPPSRAAFAAAPSAAAADSASAAATTATAYYGNHYCPYL
ncbi:unnamed protein product [Closterium sp. NIES-54]